MSDIHADPEKIRRFVDQLAKFESEVRGINEALWTALGKLGQSWRDRQYAEFRERLAASRKRLLAFGEEAARVRPMLLRDAERLDEIARR